MFLILKRGKINASRVSDVDKRLCTPNDVHAIWKFGGGGVKKKTKSTLCIVVYSIPRGLVSNIPW